MKNFLTLLAFCLSLPSNIAQNSTYFKGEALIKTSENFNIQSLHKSLTRLQGKETHLSIKKQLSKSLNIWHLSFNEEIDHRTFLMHLQGINGIEIAQLNHKISFRETFPNDSLFSRQWQYINDGSNGGTEDADIDAEMAWGITTGGTTALGDTIVVAVIDDGINLNHPDFEGNLWVNRDEIPNNGIDDDENGYIDDYQGWNVHTESDDLNGGDHGTPVAGIIGAKGDNGIGVCGVNWNIKLMIIQNNDFSEAAVIASYAYPLEARKRYNETNGAEGAFVVATNSSWGIDYGNPKDSPLWCAFYDSLGQAGILNCVATTNEDVNVDELGDLPSGCSSEFLIAVTNVNRSDIKDPLAGYGSINIDIGAHGTQSYTTLFNDYGTFGGTSGATPHVTGAVALLYSIDSDQISKLAKEDPAAAARKVRNLIYDGADFNESLKGITSQEGRLNLYGSLIEAMQQCSTCPEPFSVQAEARMDGGLSISWNTSDTVKIFDLRIRPAGSSNWETMLNVNSPLLIRDLDLCQEYEVQLSSICTDTTSGFGATHIFLTDGCCEMVEDVVFSNLKETSFNIYWRDIYEANSYSILILRDMDTFLRIDEYRDTMLCVLDAQPCTEYRLIVQTSCDRGSSIKTASFEFSTKGCGICLEGEYCTSQGYAIDEWIESIEIGDFTNSSGNNSGYLSFTEEKVMLETGKSYPIELTPGFYDYPFTESWRLWIDLNQDESFDTTEILFESSMPSSETIIGSIIIPSRTPIGETRMRLTMNYLPFGEFLGPCENDVCGETEDYCVDITLARGNCDLAINLGASNINLNSAHLTWDDFTDDHSNHNLRYKTIQSSDWVKIDNVDSPFLLDNLNECLQYEFQIEANCANDVEMSTSGFTESFIFNTDCTTSINLFGENTAFSIHPNPTENFLHVVTKNLDPQESLLQLIDSGGKVSFENRQNISETSPWTVDLSSLPRGLYYVRFVMDKDIFTTKVILQ